MQEVSKIVEFVCVGKTCHPSGWERIFTYPFTL